MSAIKRIIKKLTIIVLPVSLAWLPPAYPATTVTVGVYQFPPVAGIGRDGQPTGLLGDLLSKLEADGSEVDFHAFHTSPKRRHLDFDAGLCDVIFFESAHWGWSERDVTMSQPILADEELYVALKKPGRDQSFFDNLASRRIVAMAGYHYGFADFETDSSELRRRFQIEFSDSHNRNLQLIKADRPTVAEVAIISRSYLQQHLSRHPEDHDKFLISEKPDQRYLLRIIAREGSPLKADGVIHLLAPLVKNGDYQQMVESWNLQLPPEFPSGLDLP